MAGKRIFISYKRNTELDHPLAERLLVRLEQHGHSVFLDQTMAVGENWVRRIQHEVAAADFLVLLLSEHSVQSAMVVEEVRMAQEQRRRSGFQPVILPVRVGFEGALPYDLGAWLNSINYALWRGPADDERLVAELLRAMAGQAELPAPALSGAGLAADVPLPSANPRASLLGQPRGPLEAPEGTISPESPFYVERLADGVAADEQQHAGYTLTIQAPRQMGKSSLLGRVMERAQQAGKQVAFVDFQGFGAAELADPQALYYQFCYLVEDALGLDSELDKHWGAPLPPLQKATRFMERRILPVCKAGGLLLALDEADALLGAQTSSDFFGMLRSWHNMRALRPAWKLFALAQVISTEPHMLIENLSQSPFNVGTNLRLEDFTLDEAGRMNASHGAALSAGELAWVHALLGGHPYLMRKALYLLSKRRYALTELLHEADSESGPFGDHLRALLARLHARPDLPPAMRSALRTGSADMAQRHRLMAGGVLKEVGGRLLPRCPLYGTYLARVL
jgi:hypothetical protein